MPGDRVRHVRLLEPCNGVRVERQALGRHRILEVLERHPGAPAPRPVVLVVSRVMGQLPAFVMVRSSHEETTGALVAEADR